VVILSKITLDVTLTLGGSMSGRQVTASTGEGVAPDTATPGLIPGEKLLANLREFSKTQATLMATALATGIFILRCIWVTNFNLEQARAVFVDTSIGDAVRAVAFSVFLPILLFASLALAFYAGESLRRRGYRHHLTINYAVSGLLLSLLALFLYGELSKSGGLAAIIVTTIIVSLYPLFAAWMGFVSTRLGHRPEETSTFGAAGRWLAAFRPFAVAFFVVFLIYLLSFGIFTRRMWLPLEEFVPQQGGPYIGYLLKESSGTLFVLGDQDRQVHEFSKDAVRYRIRCQGYPVKCSDPSLSRFMTPPPTPPSTSSPSSRKP
jgi:hypothetical protein